MQTVLIYKFTFHTIVTLSHENNPIYVNTYNNVSLSRLLDILCYDIQVMR